MGLDYLHSQEMIHGDVKGVCVSTVVTYRVSTDACSSSRPTS